METPRTTQETDEMREVTTVREVPRTPVHCDRPMAKFVVGLAKKRFRYKCGVCEAEQVGEVIE